MTMTFQRLVPVLALAAGLAGCGFNGINPGASDRELRARAGSPAHVWKNPDGTETWEYRYGPTGWTTYMVDVGPDHAVRSVHQVLGDEYFAKVVPGMSRDNVRRLLGGPKEIARYAGANEEVWSWRYKEAGNWYRLFNVAFDSTGAVRRTFRLDDPYMYDKGGKGKGG